MKELFNYTRQLADSIISLVEDIAVLQRNLKEKKNSSSTEEKIQNIVKEVKKYTYFLRVLEHVSYLEDYKNDIIRATCSIDEFLSEKTYSNEAVRKITSHLSSICAEYNASMAPDNAVAPSTILRKTIDKLEVTMKIMEEILLGFYGLTSPVDDLEQKLIVSVEGLFTVRVEDLEMEEKLLLEEFFGLLQAGFEGKSQESWETAYIKCTDIMNKLKIRAGMTPDSDLSIDID